MKSFSLLQEWCSECQTNVKLEQEVHSRKYDYVFSVTYTGYPDEKHWLTYNELHKESIFVEWCYGGYHPFTIGWITQRAKDINPELIVKLNIIQAKRQKRFFFNVSYFVGPSSHPKRVHAAIRYVSFCVTNIIQTSSSCFRYSI